MTAPEVKVKEAPFYTAEENERYRERTEGVFDGLDQPLQAQQERLKKILHNLGIRNKNAFLVGATEENLTEIGDVLGKIPKTRMYYWEGQRAVHLRPQAGDPAVLGAGGQDTDAKRHPAAANNPAGRAADQSDPAALGVEDTSVRNPGGSPSADLTKGGIDVRETENVLKTKGKGMVLDSSLRDSLEQYPDSLPGLTPVIFEMNVIPLQDLPAVFLGVKENSSELSSLNN